MSTEELKALAEATEATSEGLKEVLAARAAHGDRAAVTASAARTPAPRAARMAQVIGRAAPSPNREGTPGRSPLALVAASQSGGLNPGDVFENSVSLALAMSEKLRGLDPSGPPHGVQRVAQARWEDRYPEERRLGNDAYANNAKVDAICAPQAVVASGGVCLPVNVDYSVPTWSTPDRPLRDGLPSYLADRGGVRFVTPPDIGVPDLQGSASGAGTGSRVWTEATDASPSGQTKPVWTVACGSEQLVYVNAIPTRIQFGNMLGRFAPEQVAANTEQAIAVAAREAELELLTLMYNASKQVKPSQYLGATRDLLASADLLVQQYRYSHRIPDNATFVAVFPSWAKGIIRADMAREVAHDNSGPQNALAITDDQINAWFAVRGIKPIWTLDGIKAATYGTGGSAVTNQFFGLMGTNAPTPTWPGQSGSAAFMLAWLLYPEGTYQFLDGGRLDLGVVRDSTLDATNDYETFVETFEGVAFRGLESYQVQSTILPTGGTAGTVGVGSYAE